MYTLTVGLEIHAELSTRTKMFCNSKNDPDEERPNVNVCPVCMGHPGTLPVINKEAVRSVLRLGVAVGGELADYTEFDRKNYFYPDIPKGYQISQYEHPLVKGGELAGVKLTRVHLEEDTASSSHESLGSPTSKSGENSLVDFNRAGVPLMELVTEPVLHDAEAASRFAKELQLLLIYLDISHANMEKGEMRVEANISVSKSVSHTDLENSDRKGGPLGTKVEVKNLNSFKAVEKAIAYEMQRHIELLERGEKVVQETRGWDEQKQATFSQRQKEDSHDYRYFPEPDLPKLFVSEVPEFSLDVLKASLSMLPEERREAYRAIGVSAELKLSSDHVEMFVADRRFGALFDETLRLQPEAPKLIANYIGTDVAGLVSKLGESGLIHITPEGLSSIITRLHAGELSSRGAKDAIIEAYTTGADLAEVSKKYIQQSDEGEIKNIVEKIIAEQTKAVAEYKEGKEASMQFLVGQGMRAMKGSGNPQVLRKVFEEILK